MLEGLNVEYSTKGPDLPDVQTGVVCVEGTLVYNSIKWGL